jgi:hypothetical protein
MQAKRVPLSRLRKKTPEGRKGLRPQPVLLIPSRGPAWLKRELERQRICILGNSDGVIVVRRDAAFSRALERGALSATSCFSGRVGATQMRRLSERAARAAEAWNWGLVAQHGGLGESDAKAFLRKLGIKATEAANVREMGRLVGPLSEEEGEEAPVRDFADFLMFRVLLAWGGVPLGTIIHQIFPVETFEPGTNTRRPVDDLHVFCWTNVTFGEEFATNTDALTASDVGWLWWWEWLEAIEFRITIHDRGHTVEGYWPDVAGDGPVWVDGVLQPPP